MMIGSVTAIRNDSMVRLSKGKMLQLCDNLITAEEKHVMKVLIGTTNPSKVKRFEDLLAGFNVEFCTLRDLNIFDEPEENGCNPLENELLKVKFYARYFDVVLCNDSGLYFEELALDDPWQPGLHVRTPNGGARLDDEAMIGYYTALISSLGGRVSAYYLDGIAVYNRGRFFPLWMPTL